MVRTRWMSLDTLCNKKASKSIENQCLILVAFFGLLKSGNTEMRADSNLVNEENNIDERQIKLFAALWRSLIWMETNKYFNLFSLTFQRCVSLLLFIACLFSWESFIMAKLLCDVNVINQYHAHCIHFKVVKCTNFYENVLSKVKIDSRSQEFVQRVKIDCFFHQREFQIHSFFELQTAIHISSALKCKCKAIIKISFQNNFPRLLSFHPNMIAFRRWTPATKRRIFHRNSKKMQWNADDFSSCSLSILLEFWKSLLRLSVEMKWKDVKTNSIVSVQRISAYSQKEKNEKKREKNEREISKCIQPLNVILGALSRGLIWI